MMLPQLVNILCQLPKSDIEPMLLDVLDHPAITPSLQVLANARLKHSLLHTYSQSLRIAKSSERTSGYFRGSLAAVLTPEMDAVQTANVLGVSPQSIKRAIKRVEQNRIDRILTGVHNKFIVPTKYRISRKPVKEDTVTNWILDHCRPTANSSNVVRCRQLDGSWSFEAKHYRTDTVADLFLKYKVNKTLRAFFLTILINLV